MTAQLSELVIVSSAPKKVSYPIIRIKASKLLFKNIVCSLKSSWLGRKNILSMTQCFVSNAFENIRAEQDDVRTFWYSSYFFRILIEEFWEHHRSVFSLRAFEWAWVMSFVWQSWIFFLNSRPAGVFGRTRPAGGADSAHPLCLTRERMAVASWARRQTKALDEYFLSKLKKS